MRVKISTTKPSQSQCYNWGGMETQHSIPADLASRGQAIYEEQIRHLVDPQQKGKFVIIDIYSGDYEVHERDADATRNLLKRRPDAMTWAIRVGYPTAYVWLAAKPA